MTVSRLADLRLVQHLCTTNDGNGNPRRLWATYTASGHTISIVDEGYGNRPEILRNGTAVELASITITPKEYRRLRKYGEALAPAPSPFTVVDPATDHYYVLGVNEEGANQDFGPMPYNEAILTQRKLNADLDGCDYIVVHRDGLADVLVLDGPIA